MWNFERVLGFVGGVLCMAVGWYRFGLAGIFLVCATFAMGCIYLSGVNARNYEDEESEHDYCADCKYYIGAGKWEEVDHD